MILKLDFTRADVSVMSKDQVFSGLHQEYVEGAFKGILERHQLLSADGMTKRILISGSSYGALAVIACHCPSLEFVPMKSGLFKNLHFLTNKIEALLQEREVVAKSNDLVQKMKRAVKYMPFTRFIL